MNPYRFRVWDKKKKEFRTWKTIQNKKIQTPGGKCEKSYYDFGSFENKNLIFNLSTGIKTLSGKELHAEDIFLLDFGEGQGSDPLYLKYQDGVFSITEVRPVEHHYDDRYWGDLILLKKFMKEAVGILIIGNSLKNPEMLIFK